MEIRKTLHNVPDDAQLVSRLKADTSYHIYTALQVILQSFFFKEQALANQSN